MACRQRRMSLKWSEASNCEAIAGKQVYLASQSPYTPRQMLATQRLQFSTPAVSSTFALLQMD